MTVEMDDRALMLGTILKCFKTNISFCAHEQTINCLYLQVPTPTKMLPLTYNLNLNR